MPAQLTYDTSKQQRYISKHDRISFIDQDTYELYIVEVQPKSHYGKGRPRPRIRKTPVKVESFSHFDNLIPIYDDPIDFTGQIEWKKTERIDTEKGASQPESDGYIIFRQADRAKQSKFFKAFFLDQTQGQTFADNYEVNLVKETRTGVNKNMGKRGTVTGTTTTLLSTNFVDIGNQYEYNGQQRAKKGDACIIIPRETTLAELEDIDSYITISVDGGTAFKYTIVNQDGGIKPLQTFHWKVYLTRRMQ